MADSREVAAFQHCYSLLLEGIQHELGEIVPKLYANGLVSRGNRDESLSPFVPLNRRASQLLTVLESKIHVEPDSFHSILRELHSCPTLTPLAQKLRSKLEDQQLGDKASPQVPDGKSLKQKSKSSELGSPAAAAQTTTEFEELTDEMKHHPRIRRTLKCKEHDEVLKLFCCTCNSHICKDCIIYEHASHDHKFVIESASLSRHEQSLQTPNEATTKVTEDLDECPQMQEPSCKKHDELLKLFCFTCNCLICRDCIIYDHTHHRHRFVKESAPQVREKLKEDLTPLKQVQSKVTAAVLSIQAAQRKVSENHATVSTTISQSIDQMITVLQQRKMELLSKASQLKEEKMRVLKDQEERLTISLTEAQHLVDQAEKTLQTATDTELLEKQQQIATEMKESYRKQLHQIVDLEPAARADICIDMSFNQLSLHRVGSIGLDSQLALKRVSSVDLNRISLTKCRVEGLLDETAVVNRQAQFTLHLVASTGCPYRGSANITVEVKSHVDGSIAPAVITPVNGTYNIKYTPHMRGRYSIFVKISGRNISESPFSVFVRMPPTQLQRPVRTITEGVNNPYGIAVSKSDEVMAAEYSESCVTVFDKQGRKLKVIRHKHLQNPYGITSDPVGNIYICSAKTILKLNKDGVIQKITKSKGDNLSFIRVIGDMLFVCCGVSDRVLIYDCNTLELIKSLGKKGKRTGEFLEPRDALCVNGEVYVSDCKNHRIQVFDKERLTFIRSFSVVNNTSTRTLCTPHGMCISPDGLLYVTSYECNCVLVFTVNGNFVASLGEVKEPLGIAVDSDGFIYVTCVHAILVF